MHSDEAVRSSQEIVAHLLRRRSLDRESDARLYEAFFAKGVEDLVRMQGEALGAQIAQLEGVVYLLPNDGNTFLGFSRSELKNRLTRGGRRDRAERDAEYSLALFAILVLLSQFYGGQDATGRKRDYLPFGEYQNAVADGLAAGASASGGAASGWLSYPELLGAWNALISSGEISGKRNTKEGMLRVVLAFLKQQGLALLAGDENVYVQPKLDHVMKWTFLNRASPDAVDRLERFLGHGLEGHVLEGKGPEGQEPEEQEPQDDQEAAAAEAGGEACDELD